MTDLEARIAEIEGRLEKATAGPWSVEECGEKGYGSHMVGVVFAMEGDPNCERPLSGWLEPYDDLGNEIEYYRDHLVADCDFHNGNSGADAIFIAHAPSDIRFLLDALAKERARVLEEAAKVADEFAALSASRPGEWLLKLRSEHIASAIRALAKERNR